MPAFTCVITGTDTEVGKTRVACALLLAGRQLRLRAAGYKPVATGARADARGELRNVDARLLLQHGNVELPYDSVNPYVFAPPIAPHLAAAAAGREIELTTLDRVHREVAAAADLVVVEGAGGWRVPLNDASDFSDWIAARGWPVVLVVAIRLGCLNHALLSAEAIARQANLVGWVANLLPPELRESDALIETLQRRLPVPMIARSRANQPLASFAELLQPWLAGTLRGSQDSDPAAAAPAAD
jgi:dethiobiotin synthetase